MIIGVTGSMGAGKSLFSKVLAEALTRLGVTDVAIIDADPLAKSIIEKSFREPDSPLANQLIERFGHEIRNADGTLNRALLAERAFKDSASASAVNAIVHPYVTEEIRAMTAAKGSSILDVPLLFESRLDEMCDVTICVTAPREIRRLRCARFTDFDLRDSRQWPEEKKSALATHVVANDAAPEELEPKAVEIAKKLMNFA